jgi:type I restriction enzyme S subunit
MTLKTFFEKFDQFADAPGAVAKMRELVLELAIQGKLVAQCGDEEPALKQLERIAAKKSKTGRVARVKAGRSGSSAAEETETHVPSGWEKTSLAELVTVLNGRAYSKDELLAAGTPVLRVGNLFTSKHWYFSDLELEPDKYCDKGDLIFAWSASFGPFIWPGPKVIYHYHIWKLELHSEADLHKGYLYWFLQNKTQEIKRAGHGVSMLHMTKEKMEKLEVMLPPFAEQQRIVAKVDELMALCDRLEAQQQERDTRHADLARASLARFAAEPTPANLHFLFHKSYTIPPADLRKSILDLAVYGKLAIPAPDDDEIPAIEEFREAAAWLASSLGLRAPKESLDEAKPPFEIPDHWRWMALADVGAAQTGTTPSKNDHKAFNGDIPFVKPADILPDGINYSNESLTRYGAESGSRLAPAGSLLMVCIGTIGKCNLIERECAFNQQINSLSPVQWVDSQYLLLAVRAPHFQDAAWKKSSSTTIAILNKGKWLSIPVPIPPLAEQRRIVAKVDHLMALVDELETQLAASRATAKNLLEALVAELTTAS